MSADFRFAKFDISISPKKLISLPEYKGSTFRGGFGHAFKAICCALKSKTCNICLLREKCVYSYIFETPSPKNSEASKRYPHAPHPFIIEPPEDGKLHYREGEILNFSLILIGKAIDYLPYFIYALDELGRIGIGKNKGKYSLKAVFSQISDDYAEIYNSKDKTLNSNYKVISYQSLEEKYKDCSEVNCLSVNFLTPVRIKHNNKLIDKLEFHTFINALLRRISLLSFFHCGGELKVDFKKMNRMAKDIRVKESNLKWYDWERYSKRQDTRMKLGGLIGDITFEGNITPFLPFLTLGKYIHVGKGTSFGLGKYEITPF